MIRTVACLAPASHDPQAASASASAGAAVSRGLAGHGVGRPRKTPSAAQRNASMDPVAVRPACIDPNREPPFGLYVASGHGSSQDPRPGSGLESAARCAGRRFAGRGGCGMIWRSVVAAASVAVIGLTAGAQAQETDFDLEVNAGAVFPLSKYKRTIDGDIGAGLSLQAGYRYMLSDNIGLGIAGGPLFTFLPTAEPFEGPDDELDDEISSNFVFTAGPKLSLLTDVIETYLTVQGGYYRDMSGPMDDELGRLQRRRRSPHPHHRKRQPRRVRPLRLLGSERGARHDERPAVGDDRCVVQPLLRTAPGSGVHGAAASAARSGQAADRPPRRELRLRQVERSRRRAADPRRGGAHADGEPEIDVIGRRPHRRVGNRRVQRAAVGASRGDGRRIPGARRHRVEPSDAVGYGESVRSRRTRPRKAARRTGASS